MNILACFSPVFEHFICQSSTNISLTFKDFLLTTFHLFNELVTTDIYPDEWATMRIIANEILLKTLQVLITYILLSPFCWIPSLWIVFCKYVLQSIFLYHFTNFSWMISWFSFSVTEIKLGKCNTFILRNTVSFWDIFK